MTDLTRRRMLAVTAVTAAATGMPLAALAAAEALPVWRWRGSAMGGPAEITLWHGNPRRAQKTLGHCLAEIERLERVFSLYRADSQLVTLNRAGRLAAPAHDLVALLAQSQRYGALTDGAFDVTVQPLWRLYAHHFARPGAEAPDPSAVERVLALIDYRAIDVEPGEIRLARPGMAVTLNGIAQGAITDRIAEMLRDDGFDNVLVDCGETRAVGGYGGDSWRVGVAEPEAPERIAEVVPLADAALATSGGYGTRFEPSGRFHHLFDPVAGDCPGAVVSATVVAPRATTADALSTVLAVTPPGRAKTLMQAFGGSRLRLVLADGRVVTHHA